MARFNRTIIIIVAVGILAATLCACLEAANYHSGSTLKCSDCHVSHASLRHNEQGEPTEWEQSPNKSLVKQSSISQMCLQCHDNRIGIPDVSGDDINNSSEEYDGTERAAGRFADGGNDNWKGHNLPGQDKPGPGECTACHEPHGNTNYRNLKALDGSEEGPVAFVNPTATGLDKYRRSNIAYVKNIGDKLCGGCHGFGAPESTVASNGDSHFIRHPSSSAELIVTMGMAGGHIDTDHWVSGREAGFESDGVQIPRVPFAMNSATSYTAAQQASSDNEVFCLSCHKAHGSVHAFGMVWPYGTGDNALSTSGCNQCHNVAGR